MNVDLDADFRAPNSNDTVIAAAVVVCVIVGLVWAITEVLGSRTHAAAGAAAAAAHVAPKRPVCSRLDETRPEACATYGQAVEEDENATH